MSFHRPTLRHDARQGMRAARPHAMLVTLVYLLLTSGLSLLVGVFVTDPITLLTELTQQGLPPEDALFIMLNKVGPVALFLHIFLAVFGVIVTFGFNRWALNCARGKSPSLGDLISGFSSVGKVLWLTVLTAGYYLGLAILLFMAVQVLSLAALWIPGGPIIIITLPLAALAIYFYRIILCSMSVYCLLDEPELGSFHALRRSISMMKGHVKDYLLLHLSFGAWYLLSFLSGILAGAAYLLFPAFGDAAAAVVSLAALPLTLWLTPYIAATECKFYDCLIDSEQAV